MLETLSKSLPRRMQAACKDHASTLQALCKHPASPLQADTFYLQATIWRIAGVQVLGRFLVFKNPPKCLYYNINKELSPEKCAILARRGVLSSKSFQNFTRSATFKVAPSADFLIPPPMPIPSRSRTRLIQSGTGSVLGLVGGGGAILAQGLAHDLQGLCMPCNPRPIPTSPRPKPRPVPASQRMVRLCRRTASQIPAEEN